jgi:hypothetical protein
VSTFDPEYDFDTALAEFERRARERRAQRSQKGPRRFSSGRAQRLMLALSALVVVAAAVVVIVTSRHTAHTPPAAVSTPLVTLTTPVTHPAVANKTVAKSLPVLKPVTVKHS